mgnify:CR=1 FL=1
MSEKDSASVEVTILGQRMMLKSDDDSKHLERVATYVKRKVDELSAQSTAPVQKLALLTALNIADDYLRTIDESREFKRLVAAKSKSLLHELEE